MKTSEMKRPATKRLQVSLLHRVLYNAVTGPVCSTARNRLSLGLADVHPSVEEDVSRHGEPSARRITTLRLSSAAISSWRVLLADSPPTAKTQAEEEQRPGERGANQETNLRSRPSGSRAELDLSSVQQFALLPHSTALHESHDCRPTAHLLPPAERPQREDCSAEQTLICNRK